METVPKRHNIVSQKLFVRRIAPLPEHRRKVNKSFKNIYSTLTWSYLTPLLYAGYTRVLEINDIFLIDDDEKNEKRMREYNSKLQILKEKNTKYAEFYAVLYALRSNILFSACSTILFIAGELGMSLMSKNLILYVEEIYTKKTNSHGRATSFAIGLSLVQLGFQFFFVWNGYKTRAFAEVCRTMLISAVYNKLMKLSPTGRQLYPPGKITSLITTDTNRIFMAARWSFIVVFFLPAFGAMLGILVHYLGVSALSGCGLVLLGVFCNILISRVLTMLRRKSLPFADKRISAVRETVENMRVIKFYGWESSFVDLIARARKMETNFLKKLGMLEGLVDASLSSIPSFGGILSFAVKIILDDSLDPSVAFPALTLFQLFVPLSMMFSTGITSHADAWASVQRLNEFFNAPEEPSYLILSEELGSVVIKNANFQWSAPLPTKRQTVNWRKRLMFFKNSNVPQSTRLNDFVEYKADEGGRAGAKKFPGLLNVNLEIKPKELVMVVGSIGTGKTTLLNAIAGLIQKNSGEVFLGGKLSTVMSMWSQNSTIRDNILFGHKYDEKKYARVVHACSLEADFDNIAGRDFAEVGERGITLSGGQKARIALARCVYNGGDIILLDDVLSAVDGKVANHIFQNCIKSLLKNSTRIMATHNLKLLKNADRVIFLDGRGAVLVGTLNELLNTNSEFKMMYESATYTSNEEIESDTESVITVDLKRQQTHTEGVALITEEKRMQGTVKMHILYQFLKSGAKIGIWFVPIIIMIQFGVATAQVMQSVFLQFWTSRKYDLPNGGYIGFYCLIIVCRVVFFVGMAISICFFCFNTSSRLHNKAVETIYRAPMNYFDSTPLGRIINRFTDDTANLDTQMFMQLRMTGFFFSMLIASLVVVFVYVPWAILALLPIILVGLVLLNFYRSSARELKRINSIFRSSMFTLVTETISGLSVILSYNRQFDFQDDLNKRIDDMNISFQVNLASQYWLSLRAVLTAIPVSLIVMLLSIYQVFDLNASKIGMLMSIIPSVSISIVALLPMLAELENQMNSVERLHELAYDLPQEAPFEILETKPSSEWPANGAIEFRHAYLRYRPNLPYVLTDFSLKVNGSEKIGICGRTGAGKSTILAALFRISELSQGEIIIDGVNIGLIGLKDLRTKLAIIPQEPVLFQGTIRSNLDPFGEHSDLELWDALRRSGVIREIDIRRNNEVEKTHRFHLDTPTNSDGSNFSLGERQLLTLARALVRNAQIIVLDEATATVDFETDKLIQQTIKREFAKCTILCIAHRLQTIIDYDKVLVMEGGQALEFDKPERLMNRDSRFAEMCRDSGIL